MRAACLGFRGTCYGRNVLQDCLCVCVPMSHCDVLKNKAGKYHWVRAQDSMLANITYTSSCCTGAYTGEMTLAVLERTINQSKQLARPVVYTPARVHDRYSVSGCMLASGSVMQ